MAKKKSVRKRSAIRRAVSKPAARSVVSARPERTRFSFVVKNLVLFIILFILFLVLYYISTNAIYKNLFWILAVLIGFVGVAFLLVLLIFVFMRIFRKY